MANALAGPDLVDRPSGMGGGNAFNAKPKSGGNLFKMREIWMNEYTDGTTTKQFPEWLAEKNHTLYQQQ